MMPNSNDVFSAVVVDSRRLEMMPKHFGPHMMKAEALIYSRMSRLSSNYRGGYWDMWKISNGGFFMTPPKADGDYSISVDGNGYEGCLSHYAAGVVACLFAYCHLWEITQEERFADLYHQLRNYALTLPEREKNLPGH